MSLPPGFKQTQTVEGWLHDHAGHLVHDVVNDIRSDGDLHQQVWKVCDTCKTGILLSVRHTWKDDVACTGYAVGSGERS